MGNVVTNPAVVLSSRETYRENTLDYSDLDAGIFLAIAMALLLSGLIVWWFYHYRCAELLTHLRETLRDLEKDQFSIARGVDGERTRIVLQSEWARIEYVGNAKEESFLLNTYFKNAWANGGNLTHLTRMRRDGKNRVIYFSRDHGLCGRRFYSIRNAIAFGKEPNALLDRITLLVFSHARGEPQKNRNIVS